MFLPIHASLEPLYYGFVSKVSSMRGNYEKKKGGPGVDTTFFGHSWGTSYDFFNGFHIQFTYILIN